MAYKEEIVVIENALTESGNSFTPEQIEQLQKDLFKMKHFGRSLWNIFWNIDKGNRASYEQKKVVYDTMGWRSRALEFVNPIKDLVVRGVNLVSGSQTTGGEIEWKGRRKGGRQPNGQQGCQKRETKKERKERKRREEEAEWSDLD